MAQCVSKIFEGGHNWEDALKILVASCVFPPEPVVSAKTSSDIAQYLHDQGHEVVVVCPPPTRNVTVEGLEERIAALKAPFPVSRVFAFSSKKSSVISRFLENISFGLSVFIFILCQRKIDLIYANVWPLFSIGLLLVAAKIKRIKVVASVQDLYPESLAVQRRVKESGSLYRTLLKLDTLIARKCDRVVVISDGFHRAYTCARQIDPSKVILVRNWVQSSQIEALPKDLARAELDKVMGLRLASEQFLFVYGGNMGVASGLDEFMAHLAKVDKRAVFLFAGDGPLVPDLKRQAQINGLESRCHFLSPWPIELTSAVFGAADALLLPTSTGHEFTSVPSKLITYMLAGKPILLLADKRSETAVELGKSGAGYLIGLRSNQAVLEGINFLLNSPVERLVSMGNSGREYAQEYYSAERAMPKLKAILESVYEN